MADLLCKPPFSGLLSYPGAFPRIEQAVSSVYRISEPRHIKGHVDISCKVAWQDLIPAQYRNVQQQTAAPLSSPIYSCCPAAAGAYP